MPVKVPVKGMSTGFSCGGMVQLLIKLLDGLGVGWPKHKVYRRQILSYAVAVQVAVQVALPGAVLTLT